MSPKRGRSRSLFLVMLAAAAAALAARRWLDVVEVEGRSMEPALIPGDWLLAERLTYRFRRPRPGEVVLAADPRHGARELIKRVAATRGGAVELRGDNRRASTDSATFGTLRDDAVGWRVLLRYWPPTRIGPVPARASGALALHGEPLAPLELGGEPACTFPDALIAGD